MNTVMTASTSMPYSPDPTPPGEISPSIMLTSAIIPPIGVKLSNIPFTAPVDVAVEVVPKSVVPRMPKRTSLPSIAAPAAWVALPPAPSSAIDITESDTRKIAPITARIA